MDFDSRTTEFITAELAAYRSPDFINGELEVMDDPESYNPAMLPSPAETVAYPGDWQEFNAGRSFMAACISRFPFYAKTDIEAAHGGTQQQ